MTPSYTKHFGICDASAAIVIDDTHFLVACDEDNKLRVYNSQHPSTPVASADISGYFAKKNAESDIEGAALLGDTVYWITSHGTNTKGKKAKARRYFFANRLEFKNGKLRHRQVGTSCRRLLKDMKSDKRLKRYRFDKAERIPPKEQGGLNIEGLAATPANELLIGFRNPIPESKALLLPLMNAADVVAGEKAEWGDPITLDLGGLGIRSVDYWPENEIYLIVAGTFDSKGHYRFYRWSGKFGDAPLWIPNIDFSGLNPEAVVTYPGILDRVQILSDDGNKKRSNRRCKKLPADSKEKYFRSIWVEI